MNGYGAACGSKRVDWKRKLSGRGLIGKRTRSLPRAVLCQSFARDFLIVKVKNFASEDLIILMAFAGDQNQIVAAGLGYCMMDRFAAVRDLFVRFAGFLNSDFCICQNSFRVFSAGIVRSKNYNVAQRSGRFTHRCAL